MLSINSISASLSISRTTISISNASGEDKSDALTSQPSAETERFRGHRQRGGGFFMRSVERAFEGLGLQFPQNISHRRDEEHVSERTEEGANPQPADLGRLVATFLRDLEHVLARIGTAQAAEASGSSIGVNVDSAVQSVQTPVKVDTANSIATSGFASANVAQAAPAVTSNSPSPVVADRSASQAVVANFGEALHGFLHELRRALRQISDGANDESGYKDRGDWSRAAGFQGYRHFSANLDNLIADLTSADEADSEKYKSLTEAFDRLVDVVGGSNAGGKPSLSDFLNKLEDEVAIQHPGTVSSGSIVSASV